MKLNAEQMKAVKCLKGPLLVLAGAGTGKTGVVTRRTGALLKEGVKPEHILAVTFTNKAAGEMRKRVTKLAGKKYDLSKMIISTFHSLAVRILRRDAQLLGYRPGFSICDQGEQIGILRKLSRQIQGLGSVKPDDLLWAISDLKNKGIDCTTAAREAIDDSEQIVASLYRRYQETLKRINAFDFDDLLLKCLEIFKSHPKALNYWQGKFRYIMVDEFQDTNNVQYQFISLLSGKHRNLCVVGDDDQSIYGWRGAVTGNILNFSRAFPGTTVITLEQNYRSREIILDAANALISNNDNRRPKNLWSRLGPGDPIAVISAEDQQDEADRIITAIHSRIRRKERKASDFAIIMRTNAQTRPFEQELRSARIPYVILGGQSFFDRKEVRDILSFLSIIANPFNDSAMLRIINTPSRGISDKTIDLLSAYAAEKKISVAASLSKAKEIAGVNDRAAAACATFARLVAGWRRTAKKKASLAGLVESIITDTSYAEEIAHLYREPLEQSARLCMAREVGEGLREHLKNEPKGNLITFLQEVMLMNKDDRKEEKGALKLITAHSAKGLEFPVVYIAGVEEGLVPHKNSEEAGTIDEERRLFYVAITRAREELTMTYCRKRLARGKTTKQTPSRFINEIPEKFLRREDKLLSTDETKAMFTELRRKMEAASQNNR